MSGFIAVHVGAGSHGEKSRPLYKNICKEACNAAIEMLQDGCNSVQAIAGAVSVLEDSPFTNAGIGSNLTVTRSVECDAAIMDGASLNFGSVGALSNIKNPIKVAERVLEGQKNGLLPFGRVPPCTIVGKGAQDWALEHGFDFCDGRLLLTSASERLYDKYMNLVQGKSLKPVHSSKCPMHGKPVHSSPSQTHHKPSDENKLLDTVGAVCVDSMGNVSGAVSSGGILLKCAGRIGQAAVYGSGCWAQNSLESDKPGIACSVTGHGEYLIKTLFAKECYQKLYDNCNSISALPDVFRKQFSKSPFLRNIVHKHAGILTLKYYSPEKLCEIAWAHNTHTMILGYQSTNRRKAIAVVSEQPEGSVYGKTIVGSEKCVRLTRR